MFLLERRERAGGRQMRNFRWRAIYTCPERWPLEYILSKLDKRNYRITKRRKVKQ